jgi:short-subunit dehydrogenase
MEIKNKQILITGANRGIGRAVAKALATDKAHLHLVVRKKDKELEEEMIAAGAASCKLWIADLADRKQVEKLILETSDLKLDILFNNAGVLTGGILEEQNMDDIYRLMQVNLLTLIQLTHAFLPRMLQRKKGKIINHSSVTAVMNIPGNTTYGASKAAVLSFTRCLRMELKGTGVTTLTLITPGIKTRMFEQISDYFGKNFEVPQDTISPTRYADMIREAILLDLESLEPKGLTGVGLKVAKYMPKLFDMEVSRRFKR